MEGRRSFEDVIRGTAEEEKLLVLTKSKSFSESFKHAALLTRRASNLLDYQERTEFEISQLLKQQGFTKAQVAQVKQAGAKDIHQAIEMLTEVKESDDFGVNTCLICEDRPPAALVRVEGCGHGFCKDCFVEYLNLKVNEAQVLSIVCPQHKCLTSLSKETIVRHLDAHQAEKFEKFHMKKKLSTNPHLRWCPKPNCEGHSFGGTTSKHLVCSVCSYEYCYYCAEPWHGETACKEQSDQLLDAWAKENDVRYCPNCRFRVEKMKGCSHMACVQCQYQWCWLCGNQWSDTHFATCAEFRKWWQDPPMIMVVLCLLSPISIVFFNTFAMGLYGISLEETENEVCSFGKVGLVVLLAVLSLIFSPFFLLLAVFCAPVWFALAASNSIGNEYLKTEAFILLVLVFFVLWVVAVLLGSVVLFVGGVLMLLSKAWTKLKNRTDYQRPSYNSSW